jgi:hypothetical protein
MSIQDVDQRFPITDNEGKATDYLMRLLRDRKSQSQTTEELAEEALATADAAQADVDILEQVVANLELDDLADVDAPTPNDGDVLTWNNADSEWQAEAPASGGGGNYVIHNLWMTDAETTFNINSTSYVAIGPFIPMIDADYFPFTHFRIIGQGSSNAAGQTITGQLATAFATPGTPVHTGGDDITLINTAFTVFDSGWLTKDAGASSGLWFPRMAWKGSNATVDLRLANLQVHYRI